jgi:uncharacterized protein with von Willebrand factor type A (vWA) domain
MRTPTLLRGADAVKLDQALLPHFLEYKHAMTGAAASEKEAEQLMRSHFGDMSPSAIKRRLAQDAADLAERRQQLEQQDPGSAEVWKLTSPGTVRGRENLAGYN